MINNPLAEDLDHILKYTEGLWEEIREQRLFITGGTGFFGSWLLESFVWANDKLGLNSSITVLTRDHEKFKKKSPHIGIHPAINFIIGDIRDYDFPAGTFSHIIHASNEASEYANKKNYLALIEAITQAAKHTLDFAKACNAKKILFTSSGSVYGDQPQEIKHISEECQRYSDINQNFFIAHGAGKYAAENLFIHYSNNWGIESKIARCFTFLGPYLPLDVNYAAGNFIRNGLRGEPLFVNGDGTPCRSYLYAADLAIWLWTILINGKSCRPYNVGSDREISISSLAKEIADISFPDLKVAINKSPDPNKSIKRYVPSTYRARKELGLKQIIDLKDTVKRTVRWYKESSENKIS